MCSNEHVLASEKLWRNAVEPVGQHPDNDIAKAFGTGIGESLCWHDMEITREDSGKPFAQLHGQAQALLEKTGTSHLHITLSHTSQHATATAVLER